MKKKDTTRTETKKKERKKETVTDTHTLKKKNLRKTKQNEKLINQVIKKKGGGNIPQFFFCMLNRVKRKYRVREKIKGKKC